MEFSAGESKYHRIIARMIIQAIASTNDSPLIVPLKARMTLTPDYNESEWLRPAFSGEYSYGQHDVQQRSHNHEPTYGGAKKTEHPKREKTPTEKIGSPSDPIEPSW